MRDQFFRHRAIGGAIRADFPRSLNGAPLLIPGAETVVRSRLQRWFAEQQIQPRSSASSTTAP
jgi:LysR family transcriptional activator of nhaA